MINKSSNIYVELPQELQSAKKKDATISISITITTPKEMEKECGKAFEKFIAKSTKEVGKNFKKLVRKRAEKILGEE